MNITKIRDGLQFQGLFIELGAELFIRVERCHKALEVSIFDDNVLLNKVACLSISDALKTIKRFKLQVGE